MLLRVIASDQADDQLRQIAVKLLFRMGLIHANGEDLLHAAKIQLKFKINLTNELEFFCRQSEIFKGCFDERSSALERLNLHHV